MLEDTLLVVCGDHGDGFGEPGLLADEPPAVSHIVPMHEELLHVPLIVREPGQRAARRVHDPAALTQFHDVALAVGAGRPTATDAFAARRVHSTKQPVTGDLRDRYERHCSSLTPYVAPSMAEDRPHPDDPTAVLKRYYWGEDAAEVVVRGPGVVDSVDAIDPDRVEEAIDPDRVEEAIDTRESTVARSREVDDDWVLDDDRTDQLAALGYY